MGPVGVGLGRLECGTSNGVIRDSKLPTRPRPNATSPRGALAASTVSCCRVLDRTAARTTLRAVLQCCTAMHSVLYCNAAGSPAVAGLGGVGGTEVGKSPGLMSPVDPRIAERLTLPQRLDRPASREAAGLSRGGGGGGGVRGGGGDAHGEGRCLGGGDGRRGRDGQERAGGGSRWCTALGPYRGMGTCAALPTVCF